MTDKGRNKLRILASEAIAITSEEGNLRVVALLSRITGKVLPLHNYSKWVKSHGSCEPMFMHLNSDACVDGKQGEECNLRLISAEEYLSRHGEVLIGTIVGVSDTSRKDAYHDGRTGEHYGGLPNGQHLIHRKGGVFLCNYVASLFPTWQSVCAEDVKAREEYTKANVEYDKVQRNNEIIENCIAQLKSLKQ